MPNIDEFKQRVLDSLNTALGSDILQLFTDGTVTDVMINPDGKLWVKKLRQGTIIPPISEGPVIVIRIPTILNLKLDDYKNNDQLTAS